MQLFQQRAGCSLRICLRERDFPLSAAARGATARCDLGFLRELAEALARDHAERLRFSLLALIELARLIHEDRLLVRRANLDLSFDQADDLVLRSRPAPEVGAADPDGH